jgi:acetyltransferase-like isoleucine patch superfamily enzyme
MIMPLRRSLGAYARTWGFRTARGASEVAPMRLRGILARRRYVTDGGHRLLVRDRVEFVKRDGGGQRLVLGDDVYIAERSRLVFEGPDGTIEVGDRTFINARSEIRARERVEIGPDCMLSFEVVVMDTNHHHLDGTVTTAPTRIGRNVWIGARTLILRGVTIGEGSVVAAGSVVTRDVPERCLIGGNPAKVIRENVAWER